MTTKTTSLADRIIPRVIDPESMRRGWDKAIIDEGQLVATDARILVVFDDPLQYTGPVAHVVNGQIVEGDEWIGRMPNWRLLVQPISDVRGWSPMPEVEGPPEGVDLRWEENFSMPIDAAHERIRIGNRDIARMYAWLISTLPNAQWGIASDNPKDSLFFRFDGGHGVVMPMKKEGDDK